MVNHQGRRGIFNFLKKMLKSISVAVKIYSNKKEITFLNKKQEEKVIFFKKGKDRNVHSCQVKSTLFFELI